MEPELKLKSILESIDAENECIPVIRRAIKTASGKLKLTNSKCIDHLIFLAASLYVIGDEFTASRLLEFIEENAIEGKYVHLDGSLAEARLLRISLHLENGEIEIADKIKSEHDLSHASNLDSFVNPIFEEIEYLDKEFHFHEKQEHTTHVYILKAAYYSLISIIGLQGRIDEIEDRINVGDIEYLESAKRKYHGLFKFYLEDVSTDRKFKKYRESWDLSS